METLPGVSVDLAIILKLVFYLMALFYVIFSVIYYYHWNQYALDPKVRGLSLLTFYLTTLPLLAIMGIVTLSA